jgi:hypothetical protein
MAVTRSGSSIAMTALGDAVTGPLFISAINFQGTGLTAGQRLLIQDTGGSTIADYITEGTSDNADLIIGREPKFWDGIKLASGTVAGTWVLSVILG